MVADLEVARRLVAMTGDEESLLAGIRRPIVLLPRLAGARGVADAVAPGNPDLGLMLPYTPLHVLLFGLDGDPPGPDALVMTSGNLGGEPIVTDDEDALRRLAPLADAWLRHDRRHPGAVRRLGEPPRRRRGAADPALPRVRPAAAGPALRHRAHPRRRRRPEEHLRRRRRPVRLAQPAHRRHGRPEHRRRGDPHRTAPGAAHRCAPRGDRRRPTPRLPLGRPGPGRTPPAGRYGWCSTTMRTSPR